MGRRPDGAEVLARLRQELGAEAVERCVPHRSTAVRLPQGAMAMRHRLPPPRLACWLLGMWRWGHWRVWVPGALERELWDLANGERRLHQVLAEATGDAEAVQTLVGDWARRGIIWLEIRGGT